MQAAYPQASSSSSAMPPALAVQGPPLLQPLMQSGDTTPDCATIEWLRPPLMPSGDITSDCAMLECQTLVCVATKAEGSQVPSNVTAVRAAPAKKAPPPPPPKHPEQQGSPALPACSALTAATNQLTVRLSNGGIPRPHEVAAHLLHEDVDWDDLVEEFNMNGREGLVSLLASIRSLTVGVRAKIARRIQKECDCRILPEVSVAIFAQVPAQ